MRFILDIEYQLSSAYLQGIIDRCLRNYTGQVYRDYHQKYTRLSNSNAEGSGGIPWYTTS